MYIIHLYMYIPLYICMYMYIYHIYICIYIYMWLILGRFEVGVWTHIPTSASTHLHIPSPQCSTLPGASSVFFCLGELGECKQSAMRTVRASIITRIMDPYSKCGHDVIYPNYMLVNTWRPIC